MSFTPLINSQRFPADLIKGAPALSLCLVLPMIIMTTHEKERRRSPRVPAAYPVAITDRRGSLIAKGRTVDISEGGVGVIVNTSKPLKQDATVFIELSLPSLSNDRHSHGRKVNYRCRVAYTRSLGQLTGCGLEFLEKL